MSFERRILHHGPTPAGVPVILSLQVVKKCWFELNRQGGCGAAELILSSGFDDRDQIEIGDWISFESTPGDRWYLGRVEERTSESPAQTRLRLEGMSIELNEVFPGGFGELADGQKPHRYAQTGLFEDDPDHGHETYDSVETATEIVQKILEQYVIPQSHITNVPSLIETPLQNAAVTSMKFRGEESVRSILKELATRAQSAAWGVNELGQFFFLRPQKDSVAKFREGLDLTSLSEIRDREHLFNRILLTGDYIYDRQDQSGDLARRSFRWRGNFVEPISRTQHGDRRIRIWLPWVRTQSDSVTFAKEFFRTYSQPVSRFLIETTAQATLPKPWEGRYAVFDLAGNLLTFSYAETVRVFFDANPRLRMELGPLDPRELWAEPPQDERWELPDKTFSAGGDVSLPPPLSTGSPPPPPPLPPDGSSVDVLSSDVSSDFSSGLSSSLLSSGLSSSLQSSGESSSATVGSSSTPESSGNSSESVSSAVSSFFGSSSAPASSLNSSTVSSDANSSTASSANSTSDSPSSDFASSGQSNSSEAASQSGTNNSQSSGAGSSGQSSLFNSSASEGASMSSGGGASGSGFGSSNGSSGGGTSAASGASSESGLPGGSNSASNAGSEPNSAGSSNLSQFSSEVSEAPLSSESELTSTI